MDLKNKMVKTDERVEEIARVLTEKSVEIKKGQNILLIGDIQAKPLILEIYKQIIKKGAYPRLRVGFEGLNKIYYTYSSNEQIEHFPEISWYENKKCDACIAIYSEEDKYETRDVDSKKIARRNKVTEKLSFEKLGKPWVVFHYPNEAYAKDAGMSLDEWKDFVFESSLYDLDKDILRWKRLRNLLNRSDKVRIIGKNTDLRFSIKGMNAIGLKDYRKKNVPDGEVFTAPVTKSVDGYIEFTYPVVRGGKKIGGVYAEFKKGKLVGINAKENLDFLKQLLSVDKGANKLGEWGIGINPKIDRFVGDLLFDEKISGTIHLAFGMAYKDCNGTNKSATHLDIVKDLRKEYGGGEIYIDNKLRFKDGKWLI